MTLMMMMPMGLMSMSSLSFMLSTSFQDISTFLLPTLVLSALTLEICSSLCSFCLELSFPAVNDLIQCF